MEKQYIIETIETKSGYNTLKVNGFFLHSKYNPISEAQKFAEKQYEPHHVHILFGYGLGYIVDSLIEQFKFDEALIVIDPLFDDLLLAVQARHIKNQVDKFLYNSDSINSLDYIMDNIRENDYPKNFKIICSPNFDKLFPELYLHVLKNVRDIQQLSIVNENTINRDSEIWQKNLSDNLLSIFNDRGLDKLQQIHSLPVIVVSGGPSLTKQLPLLKKIQEQVIIIVAGTTINSILPYGIVPDYVVSIDGSEKNYDQFKDLNFTESKLVYSVINHPGIRSVFKDGYAFSAISDSAINNYLTEKMGVHLPRLVGGGSVAHYAYSLAQYISSGPIALIGQDLAYTNNQSHAANNKQAEIIEESWKTSNNMFTVEGFDGEDVWTNTMFNTMKITFEQMVDNYPPQNVVFNCTEGGARIKGFDQKAFRDFCEEFVQEETLIKGLSIENEIYKASQGEWKDLRKVLQDELKEYDLIIKYLLRGLNALKNNRSDTYFNNQSLKALDKVDKKLAELYPKVQMDFIVSPITLEVLKGFLEKENETPVEKYNRIYNQTKTLYSKLLEATKKSKMYTENVIKRIDTEKLIKSGE